ncbi:3-deoxy-manno-octulosonate cytidylyltransferase, partial [Salmonella enterica subsp. enterica serovar Typhi]|nr:3-deoxy-manno-octulosonate cytidylyltransferase [Salmonella enterica subsp. enterica serovar Typhi]
VIPARYSSSRFKGKPLADLLGKPMVWWVYHQLKKVAGIDEVYVATDHVKIMEVCEEYGLKAILTSDAHKTHIERIYEFSQKIDADFYINVNGDEPLIEPEGIEKIIPHGIDPNGFYMSNLMTEVTNPLEVVDTSKIKIVVDRDGYGMYMARYPIPFPKGSYNFKFNKFVGVQCFTKRALEFARFTERGPVESAEDIDEYRFLENGQKVKFIKAEVTTVSVDTPKDLINASKILESRLEVSNGNY